MIKIHFNNDRKFYHLTSLLNVCVKNTRAHFRLMIITCGIFFSACTTYQAPTDLARQAYKNTKDYASLELLSQEITHGMKKTHVMELLGEPHHSPATGKEYYVSNMYVYSEQREREFAIGLILDYRLPSGEVSDVLQNHYIGQLEDAESNLTAR